jgi:5-methyltetrahydropteroyltriglutamate--homocysteine methyltransferase
LYRKDVLMIATVVGSYPKIPNRPRPATLRNAINKLDRGEITEADLQRIQDAVTIEVLQEQAEAGLDLVTDGQVRWDDEQTYLARKLSGISIQGLIRWFDTNMYYRQPFIEGPVAWQSPITVRDYTFAIEHSNKPVKAVLTGPYTLARLSVDKHYGSVGAAALALAEALNHEARALQAAGARFIQFNEPAIVRHKDDYADFVQACRALVGGLNVETALYLYFGDADGLYPQILELPFDLIGLDFCVNDVNEHLLQRTPFTKKLGLGIIDARTSKLETAEQLSERIRALSHGLAPDDVHVSPNMGLEFLPREVAQEKLRRMAQAVRHVEAVLV